MCDDLFSYRKLQLQMIRKTRSIFGILLVSIYLSADHDVMTMGAQCWELVVSRPICVLIIN